jgi:hypothetical protein
MVSSWQSIHFLSLAEEGLSPLFLLFKGLSREHRQVFNLTTERHNKIIKQHYCLVLAALTSWVSSVNAVCFSLFSFLLRLPTWHASVQQWEEKTKTEIHRSLLWAFNSLFRIQLEEGMPMHCLCQSFRKMSAHLPVTVVITSLFDSFPRFN